LVAIQYEKQHTYTSRRKQYNPGVEIPRFSFFDSPPVLDRRIWYTLDDGSVVSEDALDAYECIPISSDALAAAKITPASPAKFEEKEEEALVGSSNDTETTVVHAKIPLPTPAATEPAKFEKTEVEVEEAPAGSSNDAVLRGDALFSARAITIPVQTRVSKDVVRRGDAPFWSLPVQTRVLGEDVDADGVHRDIQRITTQNSSFNLFQGAKPKAKYDDIDDDETSGGLSFFAAKDPLRTLVKDIMKIKL
jgi:hypothetical protein